MPMNDLAREIAEHILKTHPWIEREREELRITAAAVKWDDRIYTGKRHCDCIRAAVEDGAPKPITQDQQGFVTQDGRFWNRWQAGAIAFDAGQTKTRKQKLNSEDLW